MKKLLTTIALLSICFSCRAHGAEDVFAKKRMASKKEAVLLSALFPGLGQLSSGHRIRGTLILVSEIGSLATALTANENYKTRLDDFERLKAEYDQMAAGNSSFETAQQKWSELTETRGDLDDLNLVRRAFGAAAVGIYLYNLVDIFLSHPQEASPAVGWNLRVVPGVRGALSRAVVSRRF